MKTRPKWVWASQPGTAEQGIFSALAVVEVLFAIAAYWSFAIWAHSSTHLLVGVLVAPLLLLRSDKSVDFGLRLLRPVDLDPDSSDPSWLGKIAIRVMGPLQNPKTAWRSLGPIKFIWRALVALQFVTVIIIVLPIGVLLIRIFATVFYLAPGIRSLSENWWRTLFATDAFTRLEIVPGHKNHKSMFSIDYVIDAVRRSFHREWAHSRYEKILDFVAIAGMLFISTIFLAPAYLYRMSIKSTAWVHWPLAYIARPRDIAKDVEEVRLRLWADPREWLLRFIMLLTFGGALIASIPPLTHVRDAFPGGVISVLEYAFLIDLKTLLSHPWRVVALCSASITFFLLWYGWEFSLLVARSPYHPDRSVRAMRWAAMFEYAMRIRTVCGWVFWALVIVHAALWLTPSTGWIPVYLRELLQAIYGEFLPPTLRY